MPRIIFITGASRGLGASIAQTFLKNNDIVYLNYKNSDAQARELSQNYPNAHLLKGDITDEQTIKQMLATIKQEQGRIDVLINNAAIALDSPLKSKNKTDFLKILDTNLIAPFLICKYACELMTKGSIINISSTNGIDTYYPESLDYDASKSALISLTHNLAVELAPNIRVNAVAPGWLNTDMNKNLDSQFKAKEEAKILLNRFGNPQEIAEVVFFLASEQASYINNSVIRVDGGYYAR